MSTCWLQTNGVNTHGAAAKVMIVDGLGKTNTPLHFWEDKSKLTGMPKRSLCQKNMFVTVIPLVLTPFVPFRTRSSGKEGERSHGSGIVGTLAGGKIRFHHSQDQQTATTTTETRIVSEPVLKLIEKY